LLAGRDRLLAERDGEVAQLRAENAALAVRVARLERLASRNSGNSSFPPSMDDQPGRKAPQGKRMGGKRRPGKQPGAPGSHLARREDPDQAIPHSRTGHPSAAPRWPTGGIWGWRPRISRWRSPLASARVIQHDVHEVACCCGRVYRAAPPAGAGTPGTVTYGENLQAWCVFLMVAHAVAVHRCADLIESLTGAKPSPGFVHGMIARAAAAVAGANRLIRALIILAHVVCADETPIRVGPGTKARKRYLLVACTRLLTCYFLGDRSLETFAAFVFPDLDGAVVDNRYQNYDKFPGLLMAAA
jgi:transposase